MFQLAVLKFENILIKYAYVIMMISKKIWKRNEERLKKKVWSIDNWEKWNWSADYSILRGIYLNKKQQLLMVLWKRQTDIK